jgi:hypothetical protein
MENIAVHLDRPPRYARLVAWGRATGTWWGLCTWTQRCLTDGGSQTDLSVAAWLPATSISKPSYVGERNLARIALADDQRDWPAPRVWPGWYVGPWLAGPLVLPGRLQADDRPEWERKRERGERNERKRR